MFNQTVLTITFTLPVMSDTTPVGQAADERKKGMHALSPDDTPHVCNTEDIIS